MNVGNTAAVFAPNLLRSDSVSINMLADTVHVVNITACLIQHADRVFDVAGPSGDAPPPAAARAPPTDPAAHVATGAGGAGSAGGACSTGGAGSAAERAALGAGEAEPATDEVGAAAAAPVAAEPAGAGQWYYANAEHQQEGPVRTHQALFPSHLPCSAPPTIAFASPNASPDPTLSPAPLRPLLYSTSHHPLLRAGRWTWPRCRACYATCVSHRAPSYSQKACRARLTLTLTRTRTRTRTRTPALTLPRTLPRHAELDAG